MSRQEIIQAAKEIGYEPYFKLFGNNWLINENNFWLIELTFIQKFLREVHQVDTMIEPFIGEKEDSRIYVGWHYFKNLPETNPDLEDCKDTYLEALEDVVIDSINLLQ